jgi:hypothetical protein
MHHFSRISIDYLPGRRGVVGAKRNRRAGDGPAKGVPDQVQYKAGQGNSGFVSGEQELDHMETGLGEGQRPHRES